MINVQIEKSWLTQLSSEFEKDYMRNLSLFLKEEKKTQFSHVILFKFR